jgi:hypothetical protein
LLLLQHVSKMRVKKVVSRKYFIGLNLMAHNVSICVRAGLSKPRPVPDTERNKDTKTLDYTSTPLDANTLLWRVLQSQAIRCLVLEFYVLFNFPFHI